MGRVLLLFSMAGALGVALGTIPLIGGACIWIQKISGAGFQRGQDEFSRWVRRPSVRQNDMLQGGAYSTE